MDLSIQLLFRIGSSPHQKEVFRYHPEMHSLGNDNNSRRVSPPDKFTQMHGHGVAVVGDEDSACFCGDSKHLRTSLPIQFERLVSLEIDLGFEPMDCFEYPD